MFDLNKQLRTAAQAITLAGNHINQFRPIHAVNGIGDGHCVLYFV